MTTKFDRLFKISISHNVTEGYDFHDVCKTILMRALRRKYPNCEIYSEYHPGKPNKLYPDIYLKTKKDKPRVFEIQKSITMTWINQIISKYPDEDVSIIPLKKIQEKWKARISRFSDRDLFETLKQIIEEYI